MTRALGIALAPCIALLGLALRWLTPAAAVAASVIGGLVFWGSGLPGAAMLVLFFVSGSILSAITDRGQPASGPIHGPRNARQVLANGSWAAVASLAVQWGRAAGWSAVAGALAAAQSDTWATEFGSLARGLPRLITTGAQAPRGTSGAISLPGTLGGMAGAGVLAGAGILAGAPAKPVSLGALGGIVGMLADSLMGASVQARFRCDTCNETTEWRRHTCGRPTHPVSGWSWLDNDGVNLIATGTGAVASALLSWWTS